MANIPNLNLQQRTDLILESIKMKDVDEEFANHLKLLFEERLRHEFEDFDQKLRLEGKKLIKNGTYLKKVQISGRQFIIRCPRDRDNLFKSELLK